MINEAFHLVKKFQKKAKQPCPKIPTPLNNKRRRVRTKVSVQ